MVSQIENGLFSIVIVWKGHIIKNVLRLKKRAFVNLTREYDVLYRNYNCKNIVELIETANILNSQIYHIVETNGGTPLKRFRPYTRTFVEDVFNEIINGVIFLHRNKMYHRDIKAENIVLEICSGKITARLCDYGSSINGNQLDKTFLNTNGITTSLYLPPECRKGIVVEGINNNQIIINAGIDKWGLGCLALYLFENCMYYKKKIGLMYYNFCKNPIKKNGCTK